MIKAVLDTNVYISAILFGGKPEKILDLAKRRKIEVFISNSILQELAGVLKTKFNSSDWRINQILESVGEDTALVFPCRKVKVVKKKDSDNRILECALEVKADFIVSGDKKHILPLKKFRGIKILSPSEFLEIYEKV